MKLKIASLFICAMVGCSTSQPQHERQPSSSGDSILSENFSDCRAFLDQVSNRDYLSCQLIRNGVGKDALFRITKKNGTKWSDGRKKGQEIQYAFAVTRRGLGSFILDSAPGSNRQTNLSCNSEKLEFVSKIDGHLSLKGTIEVSDETISLSIFEHLQGVQKLTDKVVCERASAKLIN